MKPLLYRAAAAADIRRVARETRAIWGSEQATAYAAQLRDDIKSLRKYPLRFPAFEARPALRRMNSGRHAVFYLMFDDRIEIVRVLHTTSDFERWF